MNFTAQVKIPKATNCRTRFMDTKKYSSVNRKKNSKGSNLTGRLLKIKPQLINATQPNISHDPTPVLANKKLMK